MIESIEIANAATYGNNPEVMSGLSKFNFVFGSNGTGKTTISRVIAADGGIPSCNVTWKGGTKLQALVYNRDFVETNFNPSTELKGVFTLGQESRETLKKITSAKAEFDALTTKIETLNRSLHGEDGSGGKMSELAGLEEELREKCWAQKVKHDAKFQGGFRGFRDTKEGFKGKILTERATNSSTVQPFADLEKRAETVYGLTPTAESCIPVVETEALLAHETNPILKKHVIGKDDVDIAAMIKKLGNSDWVRQGRGFYIANGMVCPFCQQSTTEVFAQSLNDYFDETFERDSKAIDDLTSSYKADSERLQQQIAATITDPSRFLDVEKLKVEKDLLDSKITLNIQQLGTKKREPSQTIELESLTDVVAAIKAIVDLANDQIADHNRMVANLTKERRELTAQVWKYLLEVELKADLKDYDTKRDNVTKAITSMNAQIASATADKEAQVAEIRELEKQTTSIQPTIDGINSLLSSFGFRSFSVAKADNGTCYRLVREDGTDVKQTLSEGERAFVTFLYFYHLLKGSDSETGMTIDRIVVFDDPVSSLDSDVLFIVGTLIKGLFDEVRAGTGHIKQVFVLTHNVYFHKEVTFNPRRKNGVMNEETFWVVRKTGTVSKVEPHYSNPIKTSYDLLWADVRNQDPSSLTIQNNLRRILESYFKILGCMEFDKICDKFEGNEKLICKSLFSWVHFGSHYADDDLHMSIGESTVDAYLTVFRAIFEKTGHDAHYRMMMGDAYVHVPSEEQTK